MSIDGSPALPHVSSCCASSSVAHRSTRHGSRWHSESKVLQVILVVNSLLEDRGIVIKTRLRADGTLRPPGVPLPPLRVLASSEKDAGTAA